MNTYIESPKNSAEKLVCDVHTFVCKDLNMVVEGKALYQGERRKRLTDMKARLEDAILNDLGIDRHYAAGLAREYLNITYKG